jgi:hypothetical protein
MASNSKMEIKKFNGKIFELWKLKMEDLLVDEDQWIAVDLGTAPTRTSTDDGKGCIIRQRAQSDCVSHIQYY